VFKKDLVEGKSKFWLQKENIGIIAKMATNKQVGKQLGLIRDESFNSTFELWKPILYKKYSAPKLQKKYYQKQEIIIY